MRTPRRRRIQRLLIGGSLVLAAAVATAAERTHPPATPSGPPTAAASPRFRITGHVTGLYPGSTTHLRLRLRNANPFPITVTKVRTAVQVPARSSCPRRSIKVARFTGRRRIAPRSVTRVRVEVSMRATAGDACAGQRYRLTYRGWARRT